MSLNLASIVSSSQRYFPSAVALIHDDRKMDYTELDRRVRAFAHHLRESGIYQGDKVGLLSLNCMSFTVAYFGILRSGAAVVPISFLSVGREVAYALEDSDATCLVASSDFTEAATQGFESVANCKSLMLFDESTGPLTILNGPAVDTAGDIEIAMTQAEDTAVILYTSGTTGEPKGAELTHFNMYSNAQYSCERLLGSPSNREIVGPGHVCLSALPLFHSFGQTCNQNSSIMGGGTLTYLPKFSAEAALEVMQRDHVTLFSGVPTMYFQLLNCKTSGDYDLDLKHCYSGGAAMPVEVMKAFEERYGVIILEGYGLSETSPIATFNVMWKDRIPGSIGEAIYGCDVKIADTDDREVPRGETGEILIRGYNIMKGYYKRPEATAEAFRGGWFHSGDIGKMDEDGYIYIVDRKKDLIIRGGFNVYPREVEEILYSHPAVREAAVIGVPDDQYGEEVKAFVSLKEEAGGDEILTFCKERLAATKYPRHIEILPDLPKGSTGKILKRELRKDS